MGKVKFEGITFDSDLEVEYYKYLNEEMEKGNVLDWIYHPKPIDNLLGKRSYTPDFIVLYDDRIEVVEVKGYNPYSKLIDDQIHAVMKTKSAEWLASYVCETKRSYSGYCKTRWMENIANANVLYSKVKHLQAFGWVDYDFKNPNTIANKRKEKINDLSVEIKSLLDFKKKTERYYRYHLKIVKNEKLTKPQREWYYQYVEWMKKEYGGND